MSKDAGLTREWAKIEWALSENPVMSLSYSKAKFETMHPDFTSLAQSLRLYYIQVLTGPVKLKLYLVPSLVQYLVVELAVIDDLIL